MFILFRRVLKLLMTMLFVPAMAMAQPSPAPIKLALIEGLSGGNANGGEAVFRNLVWAVERVNERGGVKTSAGPRLLTLDRHDSKGQVEEALSSLRAAIDGGAQIILQGNSSAVAAALIEAINKHNEREPSRRVVFLNYSAVDPILTNEKCSFWHFRFDAHADMRMAALMSVLKDDKSVKSAYLIGQDYSFGQAVLREGKRQLGIQRPDVQIVGEELHPLLRIKDFAPYAAKIKASGADAVLTGNFSNDLTLLVKAAKEAGFEGKFYTFYGNALGAPAAIGEAGLGKVIAVADWLPNVQTASSEAFYQSFRARYPKPADDYVHMRMHLMVEALAQAIEKASPAGQKPTAATGQDAIDLIAVAAQLERANVTLQGQNGTMRAADHQFQQPLVVGVMDRQGAPGVKFDVEGSGYGFRVIKTLPAASAEQATTCRMQRPG
ncbi:MAG: branched-chain amino acid ABC transporter substrate-binding protein [Rhodoferax sp.]|nr:branched-chain amino acid ABC transporter substrate-binding protein [Rhodoferax sp.]